jgi:rubrerythrin
LAGKWEERVRQFLIVRGGGGFMMDVNINQPERGSVMNKDIVDKLNSLIKLDIDAVSAYDQAIKKIEHPVIKQRIAEFKSDHERHIERLSDALVAVGETPTKRTPDFKGYLIEGFTSLRSLSGDEGALKAMRSNEELTNKKYKEAFEDWALDADFAEIVEDNYADEKQHLAYIEQVIESKAWEKARARY